MYALDTNRPRQPPREQRLPAISALAETDRRQHRREEEYQDVAWLQEQYRQDVRQYRDMLDKKDEQLGKKDEQQAMLQQHRQKIKEEIDFQWNQQLVDCYS